MEGHLMKIVDSAIQLSSEHSSIVEHKKRESLIVVGDGGEARTAMQENVSSNKMDVPILQQGDDSTKVTLTPEVGRRSSLREIGKKDVAESSIMMDLNIRILKELIERFTGKKIRLINLTEDGNHTSKPSVQNQQEVDSASAGSGFGVAYDFFESHYEYESTQFSAMGKILTEDGLEIDFSLELNMSREFYSEQNVSFRLGEALKDPLIINFDGKAAELTQTSFSFDIDSDGQEDQISFVSPQSGFLALDRDNDNMITSGKELFGATTGNGFEELAEYDSDGNEWIDENDSIYSQLRIWTKTGNGQDHLVALGEKGIGAIYLGNNSSPFSMKGSENQLFGQVQSSGVFLNENGSVGTIQQIDLVV